MNKGSNEENHQISKQPLVDPPKQIQTEQQEEQYNNKNPTFIEKKKTCKYPKSSNVSDFLKPVVRHEKLSYILSTTERPLLSERILDTETQFVFIHINKAGGTLVKEEVFLPAARDHKWDGAGYGSVVGWKQLIRGCGRTPSSTSSHSSNEALACGEVVNLSPCGPIGGGACPLRLLWGSHAMGLCQLNPTVPCVMAVILRHPVDRLISQYNYVCVDGKEGQKKWLESWKEMGRCPLTLLEFLDTDLTSDTFLIDHLARGADPICGVDIAFKNLIHPCMKFLFLDHLTDGFEKLSHFWGPAMKPYLLKLATNTAKKNHAPYSSRIKNQVEDSSIISKVRERLKMDIEFYEKAKGYYESQWKVPLQSCNP